MTEIYNDFRTLLTELKNEIKIVDGLIIENLKKYQITRRVNGEWELITLSQYKTSPDLILVETNEFAFTIHRDGYFTEGQQITCATEKG